MFDHVSLAVADVGRARAFYDAALAPLGARVVFVHEQWAGYGRDKPQFWIGPGVPGAPRPRTHVAFAAASRAQVDAFHAAAIAAGGTDNGAPGLRPHYHPDYYGAFVLDPDGYNVEAVCHKPE
jgi:catechol 2,3-dioxygenase-like lactoylglutathione lyase family enzyme